MLSHCKKNRFSISMMITLALMFGVVFTLSAEDEKSSAPPEVRERTKHPIPTKFVEKPELEYYPCSDCHASASDINPRKRELVDEHDTIKLKHAEEERWCLDCHDQNKRDFFRRSNGELVSFDVSFKLCGQCHGTIYRDWKAGIHGKRTGMWNGEKTYHQCVNCHNPHSPRFKPIKPEPPPLRPMEIQRPTSK